MLVMEGQYMDRVVLKRNLPPFTDRELHVLVERRWEDLLRQGSTTEVQLEYCDRKRRELSEE